MRPDTIAPVLVRIIMRYISGAFVAWGIVAPDRGPEVIADADLQTILTFVIGGLIAFLTEWWYRRARQEGGPT